MTMTPDEIEAAFPLDRSSSFWQDAYASQAHNGPDVARRYADFRTRSQRLADARVSGATGVYPDGLGGFVAMRDGIDYPARETADAATAILVHTDPQTLAERTAVRQRDAEIVRLRAEVDRLRGTLANARAADGRPRKKDR